MCVMRLVQMELYVRRVIGRRRDAPAPPAPPAPLAPLAIARTDSQAGACGRQAPEGLAASYPGLRARRRRSEGA